MQIDALPKAVQKTADAIKAFNDSSEHLTKRIISLNRVLVAATIVLAVVGAASVAANIIALAYR